MHLHDLPIVQSAQSAQSAPLAQSHTEAWLRCRDISKQFGATQVLDHISLDIRKGEFLCLLGPSGCGKTTLLRIIAGLEQQDQGQILMGSRDISRLPPAERHYGIVFQSYALFPNLNVSDNIAFALRDSRQAKQRRVDELLDLIGLQGIQQRYPAQLSGGQQQRVALARALATAPSLLLLDEPLSALDAQVRDHLQAELRRLQEKLGVTTIMVTHDQDEAAALADTIAVMHQGRIVQSGTPEQIYLQPANRFVADFVGRCNWFPVTQHQDGHWQLADEKLALHTAPTLSKQQLEVFCRPEHVQIQSEWQAHSQQANQWMAIVERVDFLAGRRRATLSLCKQRDIRFEVELHQRDAAYSQLVAGQMVCAHLPPASLTVFDTESA